MYDYVFNEEEMKKKDEEKHEKEDEKRKSASIFLIAEQEFTCYTWPSIKIKAQPTLP